MFDLYKFWVFFTSVWFFSFYLCRTTIFTCRLVLLVECVWNLMAHGDAREGKWRGNWRMEWVASTLKLPRNVVYPALLTLMRTHRLPAVDWTDAPADLNGLVCFGERRNLVSVRVPSRFKRSLIPPETLFLRTVKQTVRMNTLNA